MRKDSGPSQAVAEAEPSDPRAVVLLYHRVGVPGLDPWLLCVTPEHFEQHLQILAKFHCRPVRSIVSGLSDVRGEALAVAVTFDDGYAETAGVVAPLLAAFDVPATFYIPTGMIGSAGEFWWDELETLVLRTPQLPNRLEMQLSDRYLSWNLGAAARVDASRAQPTGWRPWEENAPTPRHALYSDLWWLCHTLAASPREEVISSIRDWAGIAVPRASHRCLARHEVRDLADNELIDLGAHSVTHSSLAMLDSATQRWEISESRRALEAIATRPISTFAYPFGKPRDYSDETIAFVGESGFDAALINDSGSVRRGCDPLCVPRLFVENWDGKRFEHELTALFS